MTKFAPVSVPPTVKSQRSLPVVASSAKKLPSSLLEKTGGGAGFSTYIALSPKQNTGIFLAVTEGVGHGQVDFYHEANNLLAALANVPPLPPRARPAPAVRRRRARRRAHAAAGAQ